MVGHPHLHTLVPLELLLALTHDLRGKVAKGGLCDQISSLASIGKKLPLHHSDVFYIPSIM